MTKITNIRKYFNNSMQRLHIIFSTQYPRIPTINVCSRVAMYMLPRIDTYVRYKYHHAALVIHNLSMINRTGFQTYDKEENYNDSHTLLIAMSSMQNSKL